MSYYSDELTDKELEALEKRIAKVYKEAEQELTKEVNEYFAKFKIRDKEMKDLVNAGEMTQAEYMKWRSTQMGRGQRFETLRDKVAERYTKANEVANAYVNDATPSIYSLNRNYEAYTIEKTVGSCDFALWDESTVRRLLVEEPDLMPYYPPERALQRGIDLAFGKDQITKRVTSGIIRGLSPGKIANELMAGITTMNRESAVRAARTGITAAENAGRLDSWRAAENMGITIRRRWVCTKDARTRFGHAMADGQTVEGTKTPFIVDGEKMMFPGDKSLGAHGWNIYNCRCTTRTVEKDGIEAEPRQMRVRDADGNWQVVNEMSYKDWEKWKQAERSNVNGVGSPKTNLTYINSESYKKKFDSISDNPDLNKSIYERCKAAVTHQSGGYREDLSIIDLTGNLVGHSSSKEDYSTLYTDAIKDAIKARKPYSLISIHNHGTNLPPSGSDLGTAGYRKYKFGIVACHDGKVYMYDVSKASPFNISIYDKWVDKFRKTEYNIGEIGAYELALKQVAEKYGVIWREIK